MGARTGAGYESRRVGRAPVRVCAGETGQGTRVGGQKDRCRGRHGSVARLNPVSFVYTRKQNPRLTNATTRNPSLFALVGGKCSTPVHQSTSRSAKKRRYPLTTIQCCSRRPSPSPSRAASMGCPRPTWRRRGATSESARAPTVAGRGTRRRGAIPYGPHTTLLLVVAASMSSTTRTERGCQQ